MSRVCALWLVIASVVGAARAMAWTQEVYVWQRRASPELTAALQATRTLAGGFHVLAAEVNWSNGQPRIFQPTLDFRQLAALRRPIGLVLRVGPYAGPFAEDDGAAGALARVAADLLTNARAAGLIPAELQVDFDCAEAKLAGYRTWLQALRKATGATPVVFTALPVWLRHEAEFAALSHAADGFVLQVHSLEKPAEPNASFTLCDPARALAWAKQAAKIGVPFRVALPTYGYLVAFDRAGKFFALAAEGPRPDWPADTQTRVVRADGIAMARLAQSLAAEPPLHCTGVIWFRLPVAGDRFNWDSATLAAVLAGELPRVKLKVEIVWSEAGLAEVTIVNEGQTTEDLPARVNVTAAGAARLLAADGLGGFRLEMHGGRVQGITRAADVSAEVSLAPGRRRKIAWLRFAHEISLDVSLPPPP